MGRYGWLPAAFPPFFVISALRRCMGRLASHKRIWIVYSNLVNWFLFAGFDVFGFAGVHSVRGSGVESGSTKAVDKTDISSDIL
jgi:hypothetical protein